MEMGEKLKALAEPTRFAIVRLLLERHHCSRSLALALGISESAVSQHMAVLKECGLVHGTRWGYRIHYELDRDAFVEMTAELTDWLARMDRIEECHGGNLCRYRQEGGCCKRGQGGAGCRKEGTQG